MAPLFRVVTMLGLTLGAGPAPTTASAKTTNAAPSTTTRCPADAAARLTATPTGMIWGETVETVCAAGGDRPPHDIPIGASVIVEPGARGQNTTYVTVGILGIDGDKPAMPSTYAALPALWAADPDRIVLRITRRPKDPDGAFELRIGERIGGGPNCHWHRSTQFVRANAVWLWPRSDAVAAVPGTVHLCDAMPEDGTFRRVRAGDPTLWPSD
jgi:hypothetical protein